MAGWGKVSGAEAPRRRPGRPRGADAAANREATPGASGSSGSGWEAQEARGTAAGAAVGKPQQKQWWVARQAVAVPEQRTQTIKRMPIALC